MGNVRKVIRNVESLGSLRIYIFVYKVSTRVLVSIVQHKRDLFSKSSNAEI